MINFFLKNIKMRTLSMQTAQLLIFSLLAITGKNKHNRTEIIILTFATLTVFFSIAHKLKHLK